jgi:hypothetical protein
LCFKQYVYLVRELLVWTKNLSILFYSKVRKGLVAVFRKQAGNLGLKYVNLSSDEIDKPGFGLKIYWSFNFIYFFFNYVMSLFYVRFDLYLNWVGNSHADFRLTKDE